MGTVALFANVPCHLFRGAKGVYNALAGSIAGIPVIEIGSEDFLLGHIQAHLDRATVEIVKRISSA